MCHVAVVQVFADQFHDFNNQSNIWHLWPITFSARHQQHPSCHRDPHQCSQNIAKVYFQHVLHQQILSQDVDIRNAYMLRLCFKFYLNAIMISGTPCASSSGPPYFTPVTEIKKPWRSCFFIEFWTKIFEKINISKHFNIKSNPGAAGIERNSAQGISSLLPNWKGMWFLLKIGSFSLNVSTHWKIDFDTPGTSAAALANYKCRCTISWTTHILLSCITPGLWTWTQRCNLNSILCINYLQVNVLSFTLVCVYYHHDLIQGANSQVKDALDPALNRVGQELGWDVFLVDPFFVWLCFYFALVNS